MSSPPIASPMGRMARSWQTFKTSLRVAWQDKELMWLPVLSFLASAIAIMGILGIGFLAGVFPQVTQPDGGVDVTAAALGFLMYLALAFVQTYFYAAMVAGAHERLSGGDPTVGSALSAANGRLGKIFVWSLVLATVNVVLQALRERAGHLGRIAVSLVGTAWNLATYFVVPIIMFEDQRLGASLKRSGGLFKKTWGETVVGEIGIGIAAGLIIIPVFLLAVVLAAALSMAGIVGLVVGIAAGAVLVVAALALVTLVQAVYKTELYRYATHGAHDAAFAGTDIEHAFRPA